MSNKKFVTCPHCNGHFPLTNNKITRGGGKSIEPLDCDDYEQEKAVKKKLKEKNIEFGNKHERGDARGRRKGPDLKQDGRTVRE